MEAKIVFWSIPARLKPNKIKRTISTITDNIPQQIHRSNYEFVLSDL